MSVARVALVVLAVLAIASGLLMLVAGEALRGIAVLGSSIGPLWLQRYLGQQNASRAQ